MAKKDSSSKKKATKKDGRASEAVDAVRAAVERTVQASAEGAQATQKRMRELLEDIAGQVARLRESVESADIATELRHLREEIERLSGRVADLEVGGRSTSTSSTPTTATSGSPPADAKSSTTAAQRAARATGAEATSSAPAKATRSTPAKATSAKETGRTAAKRTRAKASAKRPAAASGGSRAKRGGTPGS